MKQPQIIIKAGDFEGTYSLRWPMTQGDWEVIWGMAHVGILEFSSEIGRGNPLLMRALLTLALTQAGRVVEEGMLDYLDPLSQIDMDFPKAEAEKDEAFLAETSDSAEPASESENSEPIGVNSSPSSGTSLGNVPALYSGNRGSGESFTSHRET